MKLRTVIVLWLNVLTTPVSAQGIDAIPSLRSLPPNFLTQFREAQLADSLVQALSETDWRTTDPRCFNISSELLAAVNSALAKMSSVLAIVSNRNSAFITDQAIRSAVTKVETTYSRRIDELIEMGSLMVKPEGVVCIIEAETGDPET